MRYVIAIAAAAFLFPAWAGAASPQIYAASGPDYTIAFKGEAGRLSVLALEAPIYCTFTEPEERFPGTMSMFQGPTLMHEGRNGLKAPIRPNGGPSSFVDARLDGAKLTGSFTLNVTEESAHCQTVGFDAGRPAVQFAAVPYEPSSNGATKSPSKGERPIYYGSENGTEVLLETVKDSVEIRGAVPSRCPVKGAGPAGRRVSLFDDVVDAKREEDGGFHRTTQGEGKTGSKVWSESTLISGVVGEDEIAGFYQRSTVIRPAKGAPRRCTTGALPFRAVLYLPAAGN
jgi:hypothetical protein